MYAWTPPDPAGDRATRDADGLRRAGQLSFGVLRERDPEPLLARACADTIGWLEASVVEAHAVDGGRARIVERLGDAEALTGDAGWMLAELTARSASTGRSLISNHPELAPDLRDVAARLTAAGTVIHAVRLAVHGTVFGVLGYAWIGVPRPSVRTARRVLPLRRERFPRPFDRGRAGAARGRGGGHQPRRAH